MTVSLEGEDEAIQELYTLFKNDRLSTSEVERAKGLCHMLKGRYTAEQIVQMTGNSRTAASIRIMWQDLKETSRGKSSSPASTGSRNEIPADTRLDYSRISKILKAGVEPKEAAEAAELKMALATHDLKFSDIKEFLIDCKKENADPKEVIVVSRQIKSSGVPVKQVEEHYNVHAQLEKEELTMEIQKTMLDTARAFGPRKQVMEAFNAFGSLKHLQRDIQHLESTKKKREEEVRTEESKLAIIHGKAVIAEAAIAKSEALKQQGLDAPKMDKMEAASEVCGGLNNVLEEIVDRGKVASGKIEKARIDAEIEQQRKAFLKERESLQREQDIIRSKNAELKAESDLLRGQIEAALSNEANGIKERSLRLENACKASQQEIAEAAMAQINGIEVRMVALDAKMKEANKLEGELKMTREITAVIHLPALNPKLSGRYAVQFLNWTKKICSESGPNPMFTNDVTFVQVVEEAARILQAAVDRLK